MGGAIGKDPRWDCEFCGKSLRTEDGSFDMVVMAVEVVAVVVVAVVAWGGLRVDVPSVLLHNRWYFPR